MPAETLESQPCALLRASRCSNKKAPRRSHPNLARDNPEETMNKEQQIVIWQFILAFKKTTGEQVNYLELIKEGEYQERILQQARDTGNAQLVQLANRIEFGLDDEADDGVDFEDQTESVLLANAPDEVWSDGPVAQTAPAQRPPATATPPSADAGKEAEAPADRYAYRLRGALKREEFSLLHRRALDRFSQKHNMPHEQVVEIENKTRSKLHLPPLDWEQELRSVITDLLQHNDSLTNLRSQLLDTYVRRGRLTQQQFQPIYAASGKPGTAEAPAAPAVPAGNDAGGSKKTWMLVALGAIAVLLLLTLL
jgi:hypothetical protein